MGSRESKEPEGSNERKLIWYISKGALCLCGFDRSLCLQSFHLCVNKIRQSWHLTFSDCLPVSVLISHTIIVPFITCIGTPFLSREVDFHSKQTASAARLIFHLRNENHRHLSRPAGIGQQSPNLPQQSRYSFFPLTTQYLIDPAPPWLFLLCRIVSSSSRLAFASKTGPTA